MSVLFGCVFAFNTWAVVYEIQHGEYALAALVGACALWSLVMLVVELVR